MRIVTAHFDYPGDPRYARCLKALRASVRDNCPNAEFVVIELNPPAPVDGAKQGWVNNHVKLLAYSDVPIDQPTAFIDVDTLVLADMNQIFDGATFDVAIGRRPNRPSGRRPFNGGVVLFRPTEGARTFMSRWIDVDRRMLYDQAFHEVWREKYNGQNQASFGYLYERYHDIEIAEYPTRVLNACEQDWQSVSLERPYVLHVRKRLLKVALASTPIKRLSLRYRDAAKLWRKYECSDQ